MKDVDWEAMIRNILTTLVLAAILAGMVLLFAYALQKNPQLNPKPVVPSSERMGH